MMRRERESVCVRSCFLRRLLQSLASMAVMAWGVQPWC